MLGCIFLGLCFCKLCAVKTIMLSLCKGKCIYIAPLLTYLTLKALRYGSHSFTCKLHRTCLYLVSIYQMAPPQTEVADT